MAPESWQLPWLRIHLLARELVRLQLTPEVKRELERCAEVRWALINAGWFN